MKRFMVVVICVWYCRAYTFEIGDVAMAEVVTGSYCACVVYLYLGCYY